MLKHWGFEKNAGIAHAMQDETEHAHALIRPFLVLDAMHRMTPSGLNVGTDVPAILSNDLVLERKVVQHLRQVIALCEQERDYVTRDHLAPLLRDTEENHAWWLEQQLGLIQKIGLENYLQVQLS